jgi:hypothetical protein
MGRSGQHLWDHGASTGSLRSFNFAGNCFTSKQAPRPLGASELPPERLRYAVPFLPADETARGLAMVRRIAALGGRVVAASEP